MDETTPTISYHTLETSNCDYDRQILESHLNLLLIERSKVLSAIIQAMDHRVDTTGYSQSEGLYFRDPDFIEYDREQHSKSVEKLWDDLTELLESIRITKELIACFDV